MWRRSPAAQRTASCTNEDIIVLCTTVKNQPASQRLVGVRDSMEQSSPGINQFGVVASKLSLLTKTQLCIMSSDALIKTKKQLEAMLEKEENLYNSCKCEIDKAEDRIMEMGKEMQKLRTKRDDINEQLSTNSLMLDELVKELAKAQKRLDALRKQREALLA
ncbi:unnamed protein product [Enterobius vermicularis]|uniref:Citron Rho-interacting kinase n=1 Tax=Enterobius vermicularis TaxID=51028 RepID=A0A0N4VF70_ENTVE|nr:unnamed protein product [Enterobius vermicularis]